MPCITPTAAAALRDKNRGSGFIPSTLPLPGKLRQRSAAVAAVQESDDRRHCATCVNLGGTRCHALGYGVIDWPPRRCWQYQPLPDDPDQRPGRDRWPSMKPEQS